MIKMYNFPTNPPPSYPARGINADVMDSWTVNQEIWGEGFLSWNRDQKEDFGDFAKLLQAKSKEKGINLIIDRDFDPTFYDRNPDRFSCLFPVSFILLSEDYVRLEKCMRELLDMIRCHMAPTHAIHYYTQTEIEENADAHDMLVRFRDIAYQTVTNEVEHESSENTFIEYFCTHPSKCEPPSAAVADLALSNMMIYVMFQQHCFPNYYTFPALDTCSKTGYEIVTNSPITPGDDIMYLGIKGSNPKYNTFVARNICLPSRLESFIVKHTDIIKCLSPIHSNRKGDNLFSWGLSKAREIMQIRELSVTTKERNYHTSIINNLPGKKCLLFIANIPDYNSLKALALVFEFLSRGSRIVFTTTNEDFFTGYENSWFKDSRKDLCNAGLPTFFVTSRIHDTDELNDAMKVLGYETVVKHERPTHEEGGPAEKKLKTIDNESYPIVDFQLE